ncbi:hypothetical protein [Natronobacterium gregoryi]|uniref:DUF8054 domain-containing protein n=2 Tax=Natronobacterium gregoryi TaxID=44930 RepID=L0AF38_NATGS|nr:hypothetical protein [Natronobacterium gregoryi]AFZ72044.1 hypothetical protein Natgr_0803 [Natronobacterium gregoryi SP2]ELY62680.1 hypothetical protein C490_17247 [Natronobacterium gregoryi SP2]PLK20893.1 hypothetical protein CYV19_07405 [Natronobacterium gregoryi SP2]SFJ20561.1 hypothetical protein SAMN05443661_11783 [Natronobacterium gregoryi]
MTGTDSLDRFRRPEYTGDSRCVPCTILNVGLAVVFSVGVAAGVRYGAGTTAAAIAGTATLATSLLAIYLRGYLVPRTPQLTETYLPERIRRRFHDRPTGVDDGANVELAMKGIGTTPSDDESDDPGENESGRE